MKFSKQAEETIKLLGEKNLQFTLSSILNEDFYEADFTFSKTLISFLYTLEFYDLVFVAENSRVLLTQYGKNILFKLNSSLY